MDLLHWASCSPFCCDCNHRCVLVSLLQRFVLVIPQQSIAKPLVGGASVPRFDNLFQNSGLFGYIQAAGSDNSCKEAWNSSTWPLAFPRQAQCIKPRKGCRSPMCSTFDKSSWAVFLRLNLYFYFLPRKPTYFSLIYIKVRKALIQKQFMNCIIQFN